MPEAPPVLVIESMDATVDEIRGVLATADLLYSRKDVETALDRMAIEISDAIADQCPVVLCVLIGGLTPTARLIARFVFTHQLDYIHASRYRGATSGGELAWYAEPRIPLRDRVVLVVDDILDEGETLSRIVAYCHEQGAARVLTAVLVKKDRRRAVDIDADFVGLEVEDRYVFGCGMDYKEHLRHLPGIYALPKTEE